MSSFHIPRPSLPVPENPYIHSPLPLTLRGALEVLRAKDITMIEIGSGLGSFHNGPVYAYLVSDEQLGRTCTILMKLGFRRLPRHLLAFNIQTPTIVISSLCAASIDEDELEFNEGRSAHHPSPCDAAYLYINILCQIPRTKPHKHLFLHVVVWLLGLVESLKDQEMSEEGEPCLPLGEWVRIHAAPRTEKEKDIESARRRNCIDFLNSVRWHQEQVWMKGILKKLVNYEFDMNGFTKEWWKTNTGTDIKGRRLGQRSTM